MVKTSLNKKELLTKLGINPSGGNYYTLDKYLKNYKIDISHFTGKGHGKTGGLNKKDSMELCFYGSGISSHNLKMRLIRGGYKEYRCEKCGLEKWYEDEIPLELDHIDGNKFNNEFSNLQILCPNCHSVKTRNQKKRIYKKEDIPACNDKVDVIKKKPNICKVCSTETSNKAFCSNKCMEESKIINSLSKELLEKAIEKIGLNYTLLSKELGVSDNTVRKWYLRYF